MLISKNGQLSIVYFTRPATVRAGPLFDTRLATLAARLVAGATATGAVNGAGSGTAVAFDSTFSAAIAAFVIPAVAMGAGITPSPAADRAAKALLSVTERTVPPATSAAEGTVVGNLTRAVTTGTIAVTGNHAGEQDKCRNYQNK